VPRENAVRFQRHVILQPLADRAEKLLEYVPHGHDRGADIDRPGGGVPGPHLAAGTGRHVDHVNRYALMRKAKGGGQAPDSGADDDGTGKGRICSVWHGRNPSDCQL
jgi:hypothetical protein